jgi:phospholipid-binding lipoprotein MlaA
MAGGTIGKVEGIQAMRALASVAAIALAAGLPAAVSAQDAAAGSNASVVAPALDTPPSVAPGVVAGDPADAAAALAAASADEAPAQRDPLEKFNRAMWGLNMTLDRVIIKPVSSVYRAVAPRPVRRGLSRVLSNLTEPFSFINGMLQGKTKRAFNSLGRFVVNSTIGVAGLGDPASKMGMRPTPEDFGQTLAKWGVKSSAYLVLPLLGPSTIRDGVGTGVAFFADPYRIALSQSGLSTWEQRGVNAVEVISARSDLTEAGGDSFLASSLDSYAVARSAYLQRRQAAILDQDDAGDAVTSKEASGAGSTSAADDAAMQAAIADIKAQSGESAPADPAADAATPAEGSPSVATPPASPVGDAPAAAADPVAQPAPADSAAPAAGTPPSQ